MLASIVEHANTLKKAQKESFYTLLENRSKNFSSMGKELTYFFSGFNGMVWTKETETGGFECAGYSGRRTKHDFYIRVKNQSLLEAYIQKWADGKQKAVDRKAEYRQQQKKLQEDITNFVQVGDVFKASWGYEQTNVNYYQLIKLQGKRTGIFREICSEKVESYHGFHGRKIPLPGDYLGMAFQRQINIAPTNDNNEPRVFITVDSVSRAFLKKKNEDGSYSSDHYSWGY